MSRNFRVKEWAQRASYQILEIFFIPAHAITAKSVFIFAVIISSGLKIWISTLGANFDMESYRIVADLILDGKNFYLETERYNYAPPWAMVLGVIRWFQLHILQSSHQDTFHILISSFLSLIEVGLAILIRVLCGSWVIAAILVANPPLVLLTGFHAQFENFAFLFAFLACLILERHINSKMTLLAAILFGLSLSIKHILIFFPLWFLFQPSLGNRLVLVGIPYVTWFLSFLPYMFEYGAPAAIFKNVFQYRPWGFWGTFSALFDDLFPTPFINAMLQSVSSFTGPLLAWPILVITCGYIFKDQKPHQLLAFYLAAFVTLSPFFSDQCVAAPMVLAALYWRNPLMILFMLSATLGLLVSPFNISTVFPEIRAYIDDITASSMSTRQSLSYILIFVAYLAIKRQVERQPSSIIKN